MPYVASYSGTDRVNLVTNPDYWVDLRKCLSRAQLAKAEDLLTQAVIDMEGNGSVRPDVSGNRTAMVLYSIAAWNIDGEDGAVLPITEATVGLLAGPDFDLVWKRVDALNKSMSAQEQQRFPDAG
jgi:hypothetical protein